MSTPECFCCKRDTMQIVGENTLGYVYWCSFCGSIIDEEGDTGLIPKIMDTPPERPAQQWPLPIKGKEKPE